MNTFCTVAAYIGVNMCDDKKIDQVIEESFIEHMSMHGLSYGTQEEYKFRLELFSQQDAKYNAINADPENSSFTVGHNKFSTWTEAEY